ncbi:30S ribosomal protein S20 [Candidatus Dependentiae bacterium]|nr:30S ribosomal protein S20 [Candidatus Dependentiae bacterium]
MANIKSAKKRAKTNEIRRKRNVARRSDIKSATRKVLDALLDKDVETAKACLQDAEAKIARARGKGLLKKSTASRKISRLAKKVAQAAR